MTVEKVTVREDGTHFYVGLSSDTKPIASTVPPGSRLWESDTDEFYVASAAGWVKSQPSIKKLAGERNEDSTTGADHSAVAEEWFLSDAIDLSDNASTTLYTGACLCGGVYVETTIGTAAVTLDDDTSIVMTLPVSIAVGEHLFRPTIFGTSLVVNPADSSTGTIRVWLRPLDSGVSWHEQL